MNKKPNNKKMPKELAKVIDGAEKDMGEIAPDIKVKTEVMDSKDYLKKKK